MQFAARRLPPDPAMTLCLIDCGDTTADNIVAHADYGPGVVAMDVSDNLGQNVRMSVVQFNALRTRAQSLGVAAGDLDAFCGTTAGELREAKIIRMRAWLRARLGA
jgi:hypothetical protein